eukprot:c26796_g1_i2 orf=244-1953(+)
MDGGFYGSAGKRSYSYYDNDGSERNGRQKKRAISDSDQTQSAPSSADTEYRILCPGNKIGGIIGKGGNVIKAIRQETRAKVKVEDAVPGSDERVIYISSSSPKGGRDSKSKDKAGGKDGMLCPAQEALFRVHARITDTDTGSDDEDDDDSPSSVTARLLVPNNQVGCLIGKGGKIIEQMRKEIGGQIRVLPKDQLPACALPTDEIVQLSGEPALVKKALYEISSKLFENPPRERTQRSSVPQGSTIPSGDSYLTSGSLLSYGSSLVPPTGGPMLGLRHPIPSLGGLGGSEAGNAWSLGSGLSVMPSLGADVSQAGGPEEEFTVKILCPNDKIGSMIGKGGNIIRKLREDTGAKIKIGDPISDSDERIIQISSTEYLDGTTSPAIDAALQVQNRIAELIADKDTDSTTVTTRLLVPSNQIGSLIGKGGQVIADMRKSTKANIKIPSKDERPPAAGENELVLISGEQYAAQAALVQVLQKLRSNLFKGHDLGARGSSGVLPPLGLQSSAAALPSYGGRLEPGSPRRLYSLTGGLGYQGLERSASYPSYGSPIGVPVQASGRTQRDSRRKQK